MCASNEILPGTVFPRCEYAVTGKVLAVTAAQPGDIQAFLPNQHGTLQHFTPGQLESVLSSLASMESMEVSNFSWL